MQKNIRFNNFKVLHVRRRNTSYISHNSIMLNYFYARRAVFNDYKYVSYQGDIYEIFANNPINGTVLKDELKEKLRSGKLVSVWLGKKVS